MKKIISFIIVLSMAFTISTSAFAFSSIDDEVEILPESNLNSSLTINEKIGILEEIGFDRKMITKTTLEGNGREILLLTFPGGITNQVNADKKSNGDIVIEFFENGKHNILELKPNGEQFVDGNPVKVSVDMYHKTAEELQTSEANSAARMRNEDYSTAPWGSTSQYNKYTNTMVGNECSWGTSTAASLTTGVITTVLLAVFQADLSVSLPAGIVTSLATAMSTHYGIYGMEDAYFSWSFDIYEREDSMSIDRYFMYTGACYSRRNQAGTVFPHTFYRHSYFT